MITRVRLNGWKSHLETELSFSKGVNAIVGIMGAGKSSVTDAISFALFGTFPALQGRKVVLDDIIMKQPQEKEQASVEVDFQLDGKSYSIRREVRRGKPSTAEIREGGTLREVSSRGVTAEVERLLGMDYDLFSKAVYSEQNGLDYFLKIPAGQRRQHLDRMLRLDKFELARTEALSLKRAVRSGKDEKARLVADMESEGAESKAAEVGKQLEELEKRLASAEAERAAASNEVAGLREAVSRQEDAEEKVQRLSRMLEGLKGGLEEIGFREGRSRKIVRGKDLGVMDAELAKLEKAIGRRKDDLDSAKSALQASATRRDVVRESLAGLNSIEGKCPLCESAVTGEKKTQLAGQRKEELESLEEEIFRSRKLVGEARGELEVLEKRLVEAKMERERVSEAHKEIKELEKKLQEIMAVKASYEKDIEALMKGIPSDARALRKQLEEILARESGLRAEASGLRSRAADKASLLEGLEERLSLLDRYRQELSAAGRIIEALDGFALALERTQEELRSSFLENVNSIMSAVWNDVYPYGDFEAARLGIVEGDYVLQLKRGDWVDADAVSGGERSLASLALRIGFSLAFLPNLKWLILDEPTHNLDASTISSFAEALRERMHSLVEQVFLITHDPSLSDGLQNVHRLERDKSRAEPTRVGG